MNLAWPAAAAFVGMCAAIAYAVVNTPAEKSAQVTCIEQRGKWIASNWGPSNSTCEFQPVAKQ